METPWRKTPSDVIAAGDWSLDWTECLGAGITVVSATITVTDPNGVDVTEDIIVGAPVVGSPLVTAEFTGGAAPDSPLLCNIYTVAVTAVFSNGRHLTRVTPFEVWRTLPATGSLGTLPPPAPPLMCQCYDDFGWVVGGDRVGAGDAQITIVRVILPDPGNAAYPEFYAANGEVVPSGDDGRVVVNLVQGAIVEILEECGDASRIGTITVPSASMAYIPDYLTQ